MLDVALNIWAWAGTIVGALIIFTLGLLIGTIILFVLGALVTRVIIWVGGKLDESEERRNKNDDQ